MNSARLWLVLLAGFLVSCGCHKAAPDASITPPVASASDIDPHYGHLLHAQPRLPTIKVLVGDPAAPSSEMRELTAEIARENVQIATGMMFRTNMAETEAMLFVFPDAERRSFYMRNCIVPLSAAYISPSGEILQIINMRPHDEAGIPSDSNDVQFVLEVPQGWFTRHQVSLGAVVRTERGSLKETFSKPNP